MQLLLTIPLVLAAGILVVLVPGAAVLAAMRIDRIVPPPLVPAAALALGLVPLAIALSATLLLQLPIVWVAGAQAVVVLLCWSTLAGRIQREHRRGAVRSSRTTRVRARVRSILAPVQSMIAGEWLRATPVGALALALLGGVLALWVGMHAWNDSLYHIGQAQKLLALDAPSFSNTLQFRDGSAHPGYLIPAWQEVIALTAFVAHVDPVVAAWILPGLTVPISLLALGGLGWSLARARGATTIVTAACLAVMIATAPNIDAITNGMHPGAIALGVLAPLAFAMLLTALWPDDPVDSDAFSARIVSRAGTFLAAVSVAGVGMLHVGYLWVVGLGMLGYFVGWLLQAPWPRSVVRRHLVTGCVIAGVAMVCLGLLLPGLSRLEGLGRTAQQELAYNESDAYAGENGANLDAVLRGDPSGAFHLRADYLVLAGGLTLLGLLAIPLTLTAPRWPGGWYLAGSATLVLPIALSNVLFPRFVNIVTLDQARRIERVLPLTLGLAFAAAAAAWLAVALVRSGGRRRIAGATVAIAACAGTAYAAATIPPLAGYGGDRIVHPRVLVAVMLLLVAAAGAQLALRVMRAVLGDDRTPVGAPWRWPTRLLDAKTTTVATAILLIGAIPVYGALGDVPQAGRLVNVPIDQRTAEMRLFAPQVAAALRKLPAGSTVLADPRSRNGYIAMAIAPVYVVSSVPRHTALTPENRVLQRFRRAVSFSDGSFADRGKLTARERIQLLLDEQVDAVILHPRANREVVDLLDELSGVRAVGHGSNQRIWLIDRDRLSAAVKPRVLSADRVS